MLAVTVKCVLRVVMLHFLATVGRLLVGGLEGTGELMSLYLLALAVGAAKFVLVSVVRILDE